jgi:ESS family glutamate:Na+ symporter
MYETAALAVVVLFLGMQIKQRIPVLDEYCIPSPVVGGLIVAFINFCFYQGGFVFTTSESIEKLCMVVFFTSVGFQIDFSLIRRSISTFLILLVAVILLIILQNILCLSMASAFKFDNLTAFTVGSISLTGGTGITEQFGDFLEDLRLVNGQNMSFGVCTLGIIVSGLIGGPLGRHLILKNKLKPSSEEIYVEKNGDVADANMPFAAKLAKACYQMAFVVGIGAAVCDLFSFVGASIPYYIGAMLIAMILRNLSIRTGRYHFYTSELNYLGGLGLSLYLAMDFMAVTLWQLSYINMIQIAVFAAQFVLLLFFAFFMVYIMTGKDYDAAVLSATSIGAYR